MTPSLRQTTTLCLAPGEEIQYAAGPHPLDGPPVEDLPEDRLALSGWEALWKEDHATRSRWVWGRRVAVDDAAVAARRDAAFVADQEAKRAKVEVFRDTVRAVLLEWAPTVNLDRYSYGWMMAGAFSKATMAAAEESAGTGVQQGTLRVRFEDLLGRAESVAAERLG